MMGTLLRYLLLFTIVLVPAACSDSGDDTTEPGGKNVKVGNTVALASYADTSSVTTSNSTGPLAIIIQWSIVSRPVNSQAVITGSSTTTPDFRPDITGEYVIRVVISQNGQILADNEVTIVATVDDLFPVKPETHMPTTDICEACHLPGSWTLISIDHNEVLGTCESCHDGLFASGKPDTHIVTTESCDVCHTTSIWGTPIGSPDHNTFVGNCISCHNGTTASGKSAAHINTTDLCEACHRTFPAQWVPVPSAEVDHSEVLGTCSSCHNGIIATGKPIGHVVTSDECDACHYSGPQTWALPFADGTGGGTGSGGTGGNTPPPGTDHSGFVGTCVSCHNNVDTTGKSATHVLTTNVCEACHTETHWAPALRVDHSQTIGICASCHNGIIATAQNTGHLITNDDCAACHTTHAWLPALVDSTGGGTNTDPLSPTKPATHLPTTDLCEACHVPAGWTLGGVDHNQVIGTCASCHNGTLASGKSSAHIPTTDVCEACHNTIHWVPLTSITVDHTQVIGICSTCHRLPTGHVATSLECDACHYPAPQGWALPFADGTGTPLPGNGTDHSQFVGTCASCHNGTDATGQSANHIKTSNVCEACHTTGIWAPLLRIDHSQVLGLCSSCHDNVIAAGKHAQHIPTVEECDVCHSTQQWLPSALDHSGFSSNCVTCHDGKTASGQSSTHISTSDTCDACHNLFPASWAPISSAAVDHNQVVGHCSSCHSMPAGHINTTHICEACHQPGPIPWAPVVSSAVDHTQVVGSCASCHNGVIATGKPVNHPVTSEDCNVCHNIDVWLPVIQQ